MLAKVFEPRRPDGITVMSCHDESGQFHDISRFEPVRIQENDEIGKGQICLLLDGGRRRTIRAHADLPRQENEFSAFGYSRGVTVKPEWSMYPCRV